jgi:hypothetical protein
VKYVNEYFAKGHPEYRKNKTPEDKKKLKLTKLFGLFMMFLIVTAQRNRTIREIKFDNFTKQNGEARLYMFVSKTEHKVNLKISLELYELAM